MKKYKALLIILEMKIPDPEHYPQKVIWLIKWYKHIVLKNRKDDEREYD